MAGIVDTRPFFRPVASALVPVLRGLGPDDWQRGTLAGSWAVRDVVAHLVDLALRRVSFQRDGLVPPLDDPRYLRAVIEISIRVLPYAYREVPANEGDSLQVDITGPAGGAWTLTRGANRWTLGSGRREGAASRVTLADDMAWRLFYNALRADEAASAIAVEGRAELARPLLQARSIII